MSTRRGRRVVGSHAHAIRWTFGDQRVVGEAVCHAVPSADCRLTSKTCECERWGDIERRNDGTIWHKIVDYGDSTEPLWHELEVMDDCNVCLFLNEGSIGIEELTSRLTTLPLAVTPIRPVWLDEGCDWEPAPAGGAA